MGCIHYRNGMCHSNEQDTCPFLGCECTASYDAGVAEATRRGFEGFGEELTKTTSSVVEVPGEVRYALRQIHNKSPSLCSVVLRGAYNWRCGDFGGAIAIDKNSRRWERMLVTLPLAQLEKLMEEFA